MLQYRTITLWDVWLTTPSTSFYLLRTIGQREQLGVNCWIHQLKWEDYWDPCSSARNWRHPWEYERRNHAALLSQQCVVYKFRSDQCQAVYVGFTTRHLYQRIEEHKTTVVGKHVREMHGLDTDSICKNFTVWRKCLNIFDCMLNSWNAFYQTIKS